MTKNVLNYEEALKNAKDYFQGDDLASSVFISKYATTENDMYLESTPKDMHMRMAKEYARIEEKMGGENKLSVDEIFKLFNDWTIIPGGSVMNGLGNPSYIGSLSNCFVASPPQDSYSSIMNNRETLVQLMKRRGGVGIDISLLRPSGSKVNNAAKTSTGAVSFMNVYSELTKEVALNGRRGALMISMSGKHPDIDEFIRVKQDLTKITGANVSVKFDDEFMNAVINDDYYVQRFPIDLDISSIDKDSLPLNQKVFDGSKCYKKVKAKDIWNEFALCSWRTAEPGIMYEDKHLNYSPDSVYEEYKGITINPCQPSWATLLTPNGIKTMGEIKIGDVIWSSEGWTQVVNKVNSGIKDVYEYKTTAGVFYGTENHKIVSNGVKIEAKDAKSIDILAGCIDETNIF